MNPIATDGQNTEQPTRPAGLPAIDIGGVRVENPLFLAPMAGYTDAAFRSLCLEWGCGGAVTEMVNAHGLTIGHNRTGDFLETWEPVEAGAAIGAQIYGADPARMALAAEKVASMGKFAFIDINAGCPMPKIRNRGEGAGLMLAPERLAEVVRAVKGAVGGRLPVTVKTRVAWEAGKTIALELTAVIEDAGADAIFLHGRPTLARHGGDSDWAAIAAVAAARKIPVVGNGGVGSPGDVARMAAETGVAGVMLGRAAIGRPWFFREALAAMAGEQWTPPSPEEIFATIKEHLRRETELLRRREGRPRRGGKALKFDPETTACLVLRPHLIRYLRGCAGLREFAQHLNERQSPEELMARVWKVLEGMANDK